MLMSGFFTRSCFSALGVSKKHQVRNFHNLVFVFNPRICMISRMNYHRSIQTKLVNDIKTHIKKKTRYLELQEIICYSWFICSVSVTLHYQKYQTPSPQKKVRTPPWFGGSVLDYRSLPPVFESRRGHI